MAKTNPMVAPVELPDQNRESAGEVTARGEDQDLSEISSVRVMTEGTVHLAAESGEHAVVGQPNENAVGRRFPHLLLAVAIAIAVGAAVVWFLR